MGRFICEYNSITYLILWYFFKLLVEDVGEDEDEDKADKDKKKKKTIKVCNLLLFTMKRSRGCGIYGVKILKFRKT